MIYTDNDSRPVHPRHAELVEHLRDYLAEIQRSARWLGIVAANDARLLSNLARGQSYPPSVLLSLSSRLASFYSEQLTREAGQDNQPEPLPVAA